MIRDFPDEMNHTAPMTELQRAAWVAAQLRRGLPAVQCRAKWASKIAWDWARQNPFKWSVFRTLNGGASWVLDDDIVGTAREFMVAGGTWPHFLVGRDAQDKEVTKRSNVVVPDSALEPVVLTPVFPYRITAPACETTIDHWEIWSTKDGGIYWDPETTQPSGALDWSAATLAAAGYKYRVFGANAADAALTEVSNEVTPLAGEFTIVPELIGEFLNHSGGQAYGGWTLNFAGVNWPDSNPDSGCQVRSSCEGGSWAVHEQLYSIYEGLLEITFGDTFQSIQLQARYFYNGRYGDWSNVAGVAIP